jgi:hypothetical protein
MGLFYFYTVPCFWSVLLRRLFLVVLMLAVFMVTVIVTVYLLGLSPSPIP